MRFGGLAAIQFDSQYFSVPSPLLIIATLIPYFPFRSTLCIPTPSPFPPSRPWPPHSPSPSHCFAVPLPFPTPSTLLSFLSDGPDRLHRRELFPFVRPGILHDRCLHDRHRFCRFLHLPLAARLGRFQRMDVAAFSLRTPRPSQYSVPLLQR